MEPAFISSMYVVCSNQNQHIILLCVLVDLLVLLLGLGHEENKKAKIIFWHQK